MDQFHQENTLEMISSGHFLLVWITSQISMRLTQIGLAWVTCLTTFQGGKVYDYWHNTGEEEFPPGKGGTVSRRWRKECWAGKNMRCPQQYVTELGFSPQTTPNPLLLIIFLF